MLNQTSEIKTIELAHESELMTNYLQAEKINPQKKFEALQTNQGYTLLFTIDEKNTFQTIIESSGNPMNQLIDETSITGWQRKNLSAKLISAENKKQYLAYLDRGLEKLYKKLVEDNSIVAGVKFSESQVEIIAKYKFEDQKSSHLKSLEKEYNSDVSNIITCKTFDVGQNTSNKTFGLALVLKTMEGDKLFLSLNQSNDDFMCLQPDDLSWLAIPYDSKRNKNKPLEIKNVFFCESSGSHEYIVVDVVRATNSKVKDIDRYYIDVKKKQGSFWHEHDLGLEFNADNYQSCLGRKKNGKVDGLYTTGHMDSQGQLIYIPVQNYYGDGPPTVCPLFLPNNKEADCIATVRNEDLSTDLFAISGSGLYYFESSKQLPNSEGLHLFNAEVLSGTHKVCVAEHNNVVTIWGHNANNQLYYTSCLKNQLANKRSWTKPKPLLFGIQAMSPYINRKTGDNTIFVSGKNDLQRISLSNSEANSWLVEDIHLPVSYSNKSISFNSYTTTVSINNYTAYKDVNLYIKANRTSGVYINGLYYVLGDNPIMIKPDEMGQITIIERANSLVGTPFIIQAKCINPNGDIDAESMVYSVVSTEKTLKKFTDLGNNEGDISHLKQAEIEYEDGSKRKLVEGDISNHVLKEVSKALSVFNTMGNMPPVEVPNSTKGAFDDAIQSNLISGVGSTFGDIFEESKDLFNKSYNTCSDVFTTVKSAVENGVDVAVNLVVDTVNSVVELVVDIANHTYKAIINTVDAVIGAVESVFNAIKVGIKKLIDFAKFIFKIKDIKCTKKIVSQLINAYILDQVDIIRGSKHKFEESMDKFNANIQKKLDEKIEKTYCNTLLQNNKNNNHKQSINPGSQQLTFHLKQNVNQMKISDGQANDTKGIQTEISEIIGEFLENEKELFKQVKHEFDELIEEFGNLTFEQTLLIFSKILAKGLIVTSKLFISSILEILAKLGEKLMVILNTKIEIPIVSDILRFFGVDSMSYLDLFSWLAGVTFTAVYKLINNKAPFYDKDEDVQKLLSTQSLKALYDKDLKKSKLKKETQDKIYGLCYFMSSLAVGINTPLLMIKAGTEKTSKLISIPSSCLSLLSDLHLGIAHSIIKKDHIKDNTVTVIKNIADAANLLKYALYLVKKKPVSGPHLRAVINGMLTLPKAFCSIWHIYELNGVITEKKVVVIEEISHVLESLRTLSSSAAFLIKEPDTKAVLVGIVGLSNLSVASLQASVSIIKITSKEKTLEYTT